MPRDNRFMYMAQVFYVYCNDCVGFCGNVCCLVVIVKHSVISIGVLKYVVCLCKSCNVVFSVCIVTHGALDARVWEV